MAFKLSNKVAKFGEDLALEKYSSQGFSLVARNFCNPKGKRFGELDLIFIKNRSLVFVEVKTSSSANFGIASESVTTQKQQKLIRIIEWFFLRFPKYKNLACQIDVCIVLAPKLDKFSSKVIIIPNAVMLNRIY